MSTKVHISKELGFDAAHRVPAHASKCRHLHGHRYHLRVTCVGTIVDESGAPDEGMLIDFGNLKTIMTEEIHDRFDHRTIVYEGDNSLAVAMIGGGFKDSIAACKYIPTAENLARWFWELMQPRIDDHFRGNLELDEVALWETPTSVAYYRGE